MGIKLINRIERDIIYVLKMRFKKRSKRYEKDDNTECGMLGNSQVTLHIGLQINHVFEHSLHSTE
jgi:hypothetical protein